jgi:hypothetical protein
MSQGLHNYLCSFSTQGLLNRNDQLWKDWQDRVFPLGNQRGQTLISQEFVRVFGFTQTVEKDGQVVMIVKQGYIYFPGNLHIPLVNSIYLPMSSYKINNDR